MTNSAAISPIGGGATGAVRRDIVISVLESVLACTDTSFATNGSSVTIVLNGNPEVLDLPDPVPRKMLQRFAHKYNVKIEYFYHPAMFCAPTGGTNH